MATPRLWAGRNGRYWPERGRLRSWGLRPAVTDSIVGLGNIG